MIWTIETGAQTCAAGPERRPARIAKSEQHRRVANPFQSKFEYFAALPVWAVTVPRCSKCIPEMHS